MYFLNDVVGDGDNHCFMEIFIFVAKISNLTKSGLKFNLLRLMFEVFH